jgi:hypothetical protein
MCIYVFDFDSIQSGYDLEDVRAWLNGLSDVFYKYCNNDEIEES